MQIFGPFRVSTSTPVAGTSRLSPQPAAQPSAAPKSAAPVDQLDITNHLNRLESPSTVGSDIRIDRVADIRRQIANGSYETPEKLDAALSRFLDDFA